MSEMLLTIEQAAERLQLHPASVRRQVRAGLLRAIKRGRQWRVPASALYESAPCSDRAAKPPAPEVIQANSIWAEMKSRDATRRNKALMVLFRAPAAVQAIVMQRSADAAARYYATPEGEAELADWRALDGEPFHDDEGDYYTKEEEAEFRAEREAARANP
jgi:excisionase family DNA binding protein